MAESDFDYDEKNDILYIHKKCSAKGSLNIGDFIIDVSHDGRLAGLEILNASKTISKFISSRITKKMLSEIKKAGIHAEYRGNAMYVYYMLAISHRKIEIQDHLAVPMPMTVSN